MRGVAKLFADPDFKPYRGGLIGAQSDVALAKSVLDTSIRPRVEACKKRLSVRRSRDNCAPTPTSTTSSSCRTPLNLGLCSKL